MHKIVSISLIVCVFAISCRVPTTVAQASEAGKTRVSRRIQELADKAMAMAAESADRIREGMATGIDQGMDIAEKTKAVAAESADKIKEGVVVGINKGEQYADVVAMSALAVAEAIRSSASYQKAIEILQNPGAFSSAYGHLSRFRNNLDWSNPSIDYRKFLYAGTRGVSRGMEEARRVWETIPAAIRARGPEATAGALKGKHWSHIQAHSMGGSNAASNGIFEKAFPNQSRHDARMTPREINAAQSVLQSHAFHATLLESAKNAMKGGVTAAAIMSVVAVLEYGLEYQKGEITEDEMYRAIGKAIAMAGLGGAAVAGLVTAMALSFPAIMPVLTAISVPLMVIGFSVIGARLVTLGKGWYEVYVSEQPLKPIALQYWMARQYEQVKDKTAGTVTIAIEDIHELTSGNWQARPALNFR